MILNNITWPLFIRFDEKNMPQVIAVCCCCPKGKRMTVSEFLCLQKLRDDRISLQKKKIKIHVCTWVPTATGSTCHLRLMQERMLNSLVEITWWRFLKLPGGMWKWTYKWDSEKRGQQYNFSCDLLFDL